MPWEPWNGEEGHLSPEARDQGMPPGETEPQAGEGLATGNIAIQGTQVCSVARVTDVENKLMVTRGLRGER